MSDTEHRRYVAHLRSQISSEELNKVNKRMSRKRKKKAAKSMGKTVAAIAGAGIGGALLVSFFRKPAQAATPAKK